MGPGEKLRTLTLAGGVRDPVRTGWARVVVSVKPSGHGSKDTRRAFLEACVVLTGTVVVMHILDQLFDG